jgi:hypothetical protein
MTSSDQAHLARWTFLHPVSVVGEMERGHAIPDYFVAHPEIGSPISGETDWDGASGGKIQVFTGSVVVWDPAGGARELTQ